MKKQLQRIFSSIFVLLIASCQVEENVVSVAKSSGYNVKNISKSEIDSNLKIADKLEKLSSQKNNISAKNGTFKTLGLTIQTDHAKYIENGNYNSYTFSTVQQDTDNIINVLFSLNQNGEYDAYIVKYDYNKLDLENFDSTKKPGKVSLTPIDLNINSLTSKSVALWVCKYDYELVNTGELYGAGNEKYEWVLVASNCAVVNANVVDSNTENYSQGTASITTSGSMTPGGGGIATSPVSSIYDQDELIKINFVKTKLNTVFNQNRFLDSNGAIAFEIYDYLVAEKISTEAIAFSKQMLEQMRLNPGLYLDIEASSKSPMNIDRSSIPYNLTKPENQKFNEVYDVLTKSPEFQKLFVDIFGGTQTRFNVKFEIAEHVYDSTNKEVNATTSQDPVTKNIIIKISKQILNADGTMSQTKIENAKTILHECIHAYLLTITNYPLVGMDIAEVINQVLPTLNEQHYFMYNKMIPTMQRVLAEIRDFVTNQAGRTEVESLTMHPTRTPLTSEPWDWNKYYRFLSLSGLHNTSYFILNYPKDSNSNIFYNEYNNQGHRFLKN